MSVKPRKSKHFAMEETCTLLDIWSDNSIQTKFFKSYKHDVIWEEISQIMTNLGFHRSKQECCNRVNNLKRQFAKIRKTVESEEQLDNNPYWLRFITVENKKSRLENEDGALDGDSNGELNNVEFCTTDFIDSRVATEQGRGSASSAPFEEYKVSSVSSSPNAVLDNGICKSRTNVNKRQFVEDDYIKHLLENDKLMLHNQYKRLKQGEEITKAATRFFSAMTTHVNNCMNNFDRNRDFSVLNIFPTFVTPVKNSDVQSTDNVESAEVFATEEVKN